MSREAGCSPRGFIFLRARFDLASLASEAALAEEYVLIPRLGVLTATRRCVFGVTGCFPSLSNTSRLWPYNGFDADPASLVPSAKLGREENLELRYDRLRSLARTRPLTAREDAALAVSSEKRERRDRDDAEAATELADEDAPPDRLRALSRLGRLDAREDAAGLLSNSALAPPHKLTNASLPPARALSSGSAHTARTASAMSCARLLSSVCRKLDNCR